MKRIFPLILLAAYLIEFILLSFNPNSRVIWITENLIGVVTVAVLVILYCRNIRFSNLAYLFAALYVYLHTIGGHYTFELVPFEYVTEIFGFQRNHFDRICHFLVGGFALMLLELIEQKKWSNNLAFSVTFVILGVFGFAAIFELVEWIYAELADPTAGSAFLGSQGDIWDAQKDMLADGLGAIVASTVYLVRKRIFQSDAKR